MRRLTYISILYLFFSTNIFGQCIIDDLIIEAHECENGTFLIDLDFNSVGTTDSFTVVGNGTNYGTFAYSELYLTLGPLAGDGTTIYEFIIMDVNNPDCTSFTEIGPIDCDNNTDCELSNLEITIGDCNPNGTYFLTFDFDYQNTTNDFFDLFVNGTFFGFYEFGNLPVSIPSFPPSGNENDYIQICQNDLPTCCTDLEFASNCNDECVIDDLVAEVFDCENGMFFVDLDFNYEGVADSFQLIGNGNYYGTFAYVDLYLSLGPLVGDGTIDYEFIIIDNDNPDCTAEIGLGTVNCNNECEIWDLEITDYGGCHSDSSYIITINFSYENVSNDFFDIFANGEFLSFHTFSDLPLMIEEFPASGNTYDVIQVCQNDSPTCCTILEFEAVECSNVSDVDDLKTMPLQISPNPVNEFIFIKNNFNLPIESILLINAVGQEVNTFEGNSTQLDVSNFSAGIYFFKIKVGENWWSEKLFIQK